VSDTFAVILACLFAASIAALLTPFSHYAHYIVWNRTAAGCGLLGYLFANAAAGALGWLIAVRLGWRLENGLLRALGWAGLGEALVRVRVDKIPKPEGAGEGIAAVGAVGSWMLGIATWGVKRSARRCLSGLEDPALSQYVADMFRGGPADDDHLHEVIKKHLALELRRAIGILADASASAEDQIEARSFLRDSGVKWIVDYKYDRPDVRPG
jgi:hypothetical protein